MGTNLAGDVGYNNGMPRQKLHSSKKTEKWGKSCVDSIANNGKNSRDVNGRSPWEKKKQVNYDLVNSIIRESDFKHVLNPYGSEVASSQPAQLRDINLVFSKLNLMKGEEMARPFNYMSMAVNGEAVTVKEEKMQWVSLLNRH